MDETAESTVMSSFQVDFNVLIVCVSGLEVHYDDFTPALDYDSDYNATFNYTFFSQSLSLSHTYKNTRSA